MKIKYDAKDDILMYEITKDPIDYAEEMDSIIVHFTETGKPVLLEILDASKFLMNSLKATKNMMPPIVKTRKKAANNSQ